ncbi:hypothetical protein [Niveibacterium sp. 24ML]|uniref:hypothetical protein n=1 Tax=Niveibacterium sp. 24ML TaxID=2985512 RepID=UPI003B63B7DC
MYAVSFIRLDSRPRHEFVEAVLDVPRGAFVPERLRRLAFINCAMLVGLGESTLQPYSAALMADLIAPQPSHLVLEIGLGWATRQPRWRGF